jgi:hypothetical protein
VVGEVLGVRAGPGELLGEGAADVVQLGERHLDQPVPIATDRAELELEVAGQLSGADLVHPFDGQLSVGGGEEQQDQEGAGLGALGAAAGVGPQRCRQGIGGAAGVDDVREQPRAERRVHAGFPVPRRAAAACEGSLGGRWGSRSGRVRAERRPAACRTTSRRIGWASSAAS